MYRFKDSVTTSSHTLGSAEALARSFARGREIDEERGAAGARSFVSSFHVQDRRCAQDCIQCTPGPPMLGSDAAGASAAGQKAQSLWNGSTKADDSVSSITRPTKHCRSPAGAVAAGGHCAGRFTALYS
jgi:hypothetical protein